jgi:hypothetical protein
MSTVVNLGSRTAAVVKKGLLWLGIALLVSLGLVGPRAVPWAQVALWYVSGGGPPLDFDAPHDGQVVAHIDVLGRFPPDIARIRVSEVATGVTIWDVKPTTAGSACWNRCWNLALRAGSNPASFAAGHQQFNASVPQAPSFSLTRGTAYLFEVWDSKGRVEHNRFTL